MKRTTNEPNGEKNPYQLLCEEYIVLKTHVIIDHRTETVIVATKDSEIKLKEDDITALKNFYDWYDKKGDKKCAN